MLKFIIPLLAALNCVQISDNVWQCTSDDSGGLEDQYPLEPDPDNPGTYTCTNCVAISPSECETIKAAVLEKVSAVSRKVQSSQSSVSTASQELKALFDQLSNFTYCPYHYCSTVQDLQSQDGYDPSLSTDNARYYDLWTKMVSAWYDSENYKVIHMEPYAPPTYNYIGMYKSVNYLVGMWESSFNTAEQVIFRLTDSRNSLEQAKTNLQDAIDTDLPSLNSQIRSVTCASCSLSPSSSPGDSGGSGDSGDTGTDTGCLSCYTRYLENMDSSLDSINRHVYELNTKLGTFIDDVTDAIKDNLDIPLSSISNVVQRIDDYLRIDQDRLLDSIKSAVVVISNEVSDIQNHFYTSFKRADQNKNLDDEQFNLVEAINEIPQGGDSVWSRLNWFSRMEALLASIAGFGTNTAEVASEVPSEVLQEYDANMDSVRSDPSGSAARDQVESAIDTVSSVIDSFRIFDGVYEPESIRLLDSADIPFLSGGDGSQLTVEMPNVPAVYSFLRFVRYAFTALYWTAALLSFFFAILGLYAGVVALIKWASQFLGSVFSS